MEDTPLIAACAYRRIGPSEAAEKARDDLSRILAREREDLRSILGEVDLRIRDLKAQVRSTAGERYHGHRGEVAQRLHLALDAETPAWRGNLAATSRRFQEWLAQTLETELSELSGRGEEYLSGYLLSGQASLQRMVRAFQDRVAKEIERALGVTFAGASFHAAIAEPTRPNIRVGEGLRHQYRPVVVPDPDGVGPAAGVPPFSQADRLGSGEEPVPAGLPVGGWTSPGTIPSMRRIWRGSGSTTS